MQHALIISNTALDADTPLNSYIAQLKAQRDAGHNICGICHDGQNHFFAQAPDGWEFVAHQLLPEPEVDDNGNVNMQPLEHSIGKALAVNDPTPLVAPFYIFEQLFQRPLWQLWCCNHESQIELLSAVEQLFGAQHGLSEITELPLLKAQVRQLIQTHLLNS